MTTVTTISIATAVIIVTIVTTLTSVTTVTIVSTVSVNNCAYSKTCHFYCHNQKFKMRLFEVILIRCVSIKLTSNQ